MSTESKLKLYQLEHCPYCQIVRKKIHLLGLSVQLIPVPSKREERTELKKISGQNLVPVLVDGDKVVCDSAVILQHLDDKYGNGEKKSMPGNDYGMRVEAKGTLESVKAKTLQALQKEGFGVLTEIDVKATLKKKINVDVPEQLILGACNPVMAHKAMEMEPDLGLLLPCNVVIREKNKAKGIYWVSAIHPLQMLSVVGRDDMLPLAKEIREKLDRALQEISL